ncbi:MAG TPA: CpsB/CapC family capsule biosynthesis tyrosine phosphatase [Salinimicrobium sp.]|nr:CpsB/CapC family capsule biosynthesis tyrosine phosphatase [Salinimicrobium sp.]
MFSIFKKKVFLKDHLKDFTDIHNHILPGIDDGAGNVEESVELIREFRKMGVTNFIATPHIMNDYYPNTPETIQQALNTLQKELLETGLTEIKIRVAAEYMMDQSFLELLGQKKLLTLKDNLVLVEMSYFQPPINLEEILFQLQTHGYKPVLAHPERYAFFHSKKLEKFVDLKNRGCYFQLNFLSLTGHYGDNIQKTAFRLLEENMIDFIGTDTHQLRHLDKLSMTKLSQKKIEQILPVIERTRETFYQESGQ